jgi:hypothetical protein
LLLYRKTGLTTYRAGLVVSLGVALGRWSNRHWLVAAAFTLPFQQSEGGGDCLHCLLCKIEERSARGRFRALQ